jgi:hypothetical protein
MSYSLFTFTFNEYDTAQTYLNKWAKVLVQMAQREESDEKTPSSSSKSVRAQIMCISHSLPYNTAQTYLNDRVQYYFGWHN